MKCNFCEINNKVDEIVLFTDAYRDDFLLKVKENIITVENLDEYIYYKSAEKLFEGVEIGYDEKITETQVYSSENDLLKSFRDNIFLFAAAKIYQLVRELRSVKFEEWNDKSKVIFDNYYKNYFTAEYDAAIQQGKSAKEWGELQRWGNGKKNEESYLRYRTKGDARVRESHALLNFVTKKVTDSFWDEYMPPNGWYCRCRVEKMQSSGITSTNTIGLNLHKTVPDIWRFNAAKEKIIFSKKHPYFKVSKKDWDLAKKNFNLQKP
jgi:hypothetical protein